jgi:hypothetical protein
MLAPSRVVLLGALLLGYSDCGWSKPAAGSDVAGDYRLVGAAQVILEVSTERGVLRARPEGGGPPESGAAAPADCIVVAAGPLKDLLVSATFQPIETDDFSHSAAQGHAKKRRLTIAQDLGPAR